MTFANSTYNNCFLTYISPSTILEIRPLEALELQTKVWQKVNYENYPVIMHNNNMNLHNRSLIANYQL